MSDNKDNKVRQSISIDRDLQKAVMIRYLQTGGDTGDGFNGAVTAALERYLSIGEGLAETSADERVVKLFLRVWHKPQGVMERKIRDLVAAAIGVDPPK